METKDILDYLGIQADSMDELKAQFSQKYMTEKGIHENRELLAKFTGRTLAKISQSIIGKAKEDEIEITDGEFKDKPVEDIFSELTGRYKSRYESQIRDLNAQIGKTGEEAVKPWQEKVTKFESALADEKRAKQEIAQQFEAYKKDSDNRIKETRIQYLRKDIMSGIDYDPQQIGDPLKKEGWESHVSKNFRLDYDEHDNPIITDNQGRKIPNPKKADEWLSPKDVLSMEADKLGLTKKNPQGGKPAPRFQTGGQQQAGAQQQQQQQPARTPGRKVAPNMEQYLP